MIIITERSKILNIVDDWKEQHKGCRYPWYEEVLGKLSKLDLKTVSSEEISTLLGVDGWTSLTCNECGKEVKKVIRVGEEPNYETATAYMCKDCLSKAFSMISEVES